MLKGLTLFRSYMVKRSFSNITTNMKIDYSSWSKEDLIAKITQLEKSQDAKMELQLFQKLKTEETI